MDTSDNLPTEAGPKQSEHSTGNALPSRGGLQAIPLLLLAIVLGLVLARSWQTQSQSEQPDAATAAPEVQADNPHEQLSLTIHFGEDRPDLNAKIPFSSGMTVLDALRHLQSQDEQFDFQVLGSGAKTLLTEINGVQNEGVGKNARNWLYKVNSQSPGVSFAVYELQPESNILWYFGQYD